MSNPSQSALAPLANVRVLELGQIAAGPFTASLLADLGADVVKIERPDGGDGMRQWPPFSKTEDGGVFSENFASVNRNKRSVALDLKSPDDIALLKSLVAKTDILIENYRPGVLSRLGLGYDDLNAVNPKMIYCSISGYGQTGPYASKGAFDVTVQAIAGIMSVTGEPGEPPVKCGVPIGDFCAGLYAGFSVLAMLRKAEQTGQGAHIDCSMLGSLLGVSALQTSEFFGNQIPPERLGSAHPRNAPYQAFEGADTHFVIAAGNDKLWHEVCAAVGMDELASDARFLTQAARAKNQTILVDILAPVFLNYVRIDETFTTKLESQHLKRKDAESFFNFSSTIVHYDNYILINSSYKLAYFTNNQIEEFWGKFSETINLLVANPKMTIKELIDC